MPQTYEAGGRMEGKVAIKADPGGEFLTPEEAREYAKAVRKCADYVEGTIDQ